MSLIEQLREEGEAIVAQEQQRRDELEQKWQAKQAREDARRAQRTLRSRQRRARSAARQAKRVLGKEHEVRYWQFPESVHEDARKCYLIQVDGMVLRYQPGYSRGFFKFHKSTNDHWAILYVRLGGQGRFCYSSICNDGLLTQKKIAKALITADTKYFIADSVIENYQLEPVSY